MGRNVGSRSHHESLVAIAAAGLSLALIGVTPATAEGQQTPPGWKIANVARLTLVTETGVKTSFFSDTSVVTVGRGGTLELAPSRREVAKGATLVTLPSVLSSTQNLTDSVRFVLRSRRGWGVRLYRDTNADGRLDADDRELAAPLPIGTGESEPLLVVVRVPVLSTPTATDTIDLRAVSLTDSTMSAEVRHVVEGRALSADLSLSKSVDRRLAETGDVVRYTIQYALAPGAAAVEHVVIDDSLPAGLDFVSATPAATRSGQVVRWELGSLAPGASGSLMVEVAVSSSIRDSLRIRNVAHLSAGALGELLAESPELLLRRRLSYGVALQHVAALLDVGLGESVPLTLTVSNSGEGELAALRIEERLPAGLRYVPGSSVGADSVVEQSGTLTWFIREPLAAGASRRVRYALAVTSATKTSVGVAARAVSTQARSDLVTAPLRVRRGMPMQSRAAIGKVWVDRDGNGMQEPDEPGISRADVVTADGELASTDAEGRFSFTNLRTGRHAFRLDPVTIPLEYAFAPDRVSDLVTQDLNGWTSAHIDFRLVPRAGALTQAMLPLQWGLSARPLCEVIGSCLVASRGRGRAGQDFESADDSLPARTEAISEPAPGDDAALAAEGRFQYELAVRNPGGDTVRTAVHFPTFIDSSAVVRGANLSQGRGWGQGVPLTLAGGATATVRFWGRSTDRLQLAVLNDSGRSVPVIASFVPEGGGARGTTLPVFRSRSIPDAARTEGALVVEPVLEAPPSGWPGSAVFTLPAGWQLVTGSARLGDDTVLPDPVPQRDRAGGTALVWSGVGGGAPLRLRLAKGGMGEGVPVRVAALRSDEERGDRESELLAGPGIAIFSPSDGTVLSTDRLYVGVRGEARMPVTLFDGDSLVSRATLRVDGVHDFVSVGLTPGRHRLRVRLENSWGQARWDSVAVHVGGAASRLTVAADTLRLAADGHATETVRVQVADEWGVPMTGGVFVTVAAKGVTIASPDVDPTSAGTQVRSDGSGWSEVAVVAGREVGHGEIAVSAGVARARVVVALRPSVRPLFVTGVGMVGVGAAPREFGALTAMGRLGERTSLALTYDSRRLDAGRERFGRDQDPLDGSQPPVFGDASERRTRAASRYRLAARLERDRDWLALGDLTTSRFAEGLQLSSYRRALAGGAMQAGLGPVALQAFAAQSRQRLRQLQLRGTGSSGPYLLAAGIVPGTELVRLESRAPENASRLVSQQVLVRYLDYQVDYDLGTLVFKQPVASVDPFGNPLYVVATWESRDEAGARHAVWGVRAVGDAARPLGLRLAAGDSLAVGGTVVRDAAPGGVALSGGDARVSLGGMVQLTAEVARTRAADSTGTATALGGVLQSRGGALRLSGNWLRIGTGYANPASVALRGGTEELRLSAAWRLQGTDLVLEHEQQAFDALGIRRARSAGGVVQALGARARFEARLASDRYEGGVATPGEASLAQEARLTVTPSQRLTVWGEGRRRLTNAASALTPNMLGVGASFALSSALSLELRRRQLAFGGGGPSYGVTNLAMRARVAAGTDAWSAYQLAGAGGIYNSAVIGLGHRVVLGNDWAVNATAERRRGVGRALLADPVRALPFLQAEEDYWMLGGGVAFLRQGAPYHASARGEVRNGSERSSRLATVVGDLTLNKSLALLTRQDVQWNRQGVGGASGALSAGASGAASLAGLRSWQATSLWGVALRPARSNTLNVLGKVEWVKAANPLGAGVLTRRGDESRLIGALEGIWQPRRSLELVARVARREAVAALPGDGIGAGLDGGSPSAATASELPTVRARADFSSLRATVGMGGRVSFRADARLLSERTSGVARWDVAPQLVIAPMALLEVAVGHRFGDLRDPDFAAVGGRGAFVTFGARVTEKTLGGVGAFWRERLAGGREP